MQLAEPVLTTERNVLSTEQSGVLGSNLICSLYLYYESLFYCRGVLSEST